METNTEKLVQTILNIPEETQNIEFKRLNGKNVVQKILETIVAMANTEGGKIIIGVDDPEKTNYKSAERIFGIEENNELYDTLGREIQKIQPNPGNIWPPKTLSIKEKQKTIAIVEIKKAQNDFLFINNSVFIRQRKSNKKLNPQEIIKLSYAKGFNKSDREITDVDFDLLKTDYYESWREGRNIDKNIDIQNALYKTGLSKKNKKGDLKPTKAAVLLFSEFPTDLMETKSAVRIFQYKGSLENFQEVPNLIATPKTINGPIIKMIKESHYYVLNLLQTGIEIHSGFVTKYKIPTRAIKEGITNAIIHRDYHIKRDVEIKIFEDRVEIDSPGLFPSNITKSNIGLVRADDYRNDLLIKHLREFPEPPNLDRNEGVQAMQSEMDVNNLYPPIYITYPTVKDGVKLVLLNEDRPNEWGKIKKYLQENKYINNEKAREITGTIQTHKMSRMLKKWVEQGLLEKLVPETGSTKNIKYKLSNTEDIE